MNPVMMYYIVYIMEGANIASPLLTASIQYIINVALTLPAILYLDKWGRRPSMLLGSFGMMVWLFISGALQGAYGKPNIKGQPGYNSKLSDITWSIDPSHSSVSKAVVACSYLFVATFATTWVNIHTLSALRFSFHGNTNIQIRVRHHGPTRPKSSPPRSVPKPSHSPLPAIGHGTASSLSQFLHFSGTSTGRCT